jgi:hypothetical protein
MVPTNDPIVSGQVRPPVRPSRGSEAVDSRRTVDARRSGRGCARLAVIRWACASVLVAAGVLLSGCSSGTTTSSLTASARATESSRATELPLVRLPVAGDAPDSALILLPVTDGLGSRVLPTIIPAGTMYIEMSCVGSGTLTVMSSDGLVGVVIDPCVGLATTATVPSDSSDLSKFVGKALMLRIGAPSTTKWAIYIAGRQSAP